MSRYSSGVSQLKYGIFLTFEIITHFYNNYSGLSRDKQTPAQYNVS